MGRANFLGRGVFCFQRPGILGVFFFFFGGKLGSGGKPPSGSYELISLLRFCLGLENIMKIYDMTLGNT